MIDSFSDNFLALGIENPFPEVTNALIIGAHPDDIENYAAGLALRLIEWGIDVHFLIVSDGEKGATGFPRENIREMRRLEGQNAGTILGASSVTFLGYDDGEVFDSLAVREQITRIIRSTQSTLIATHDPHTRRFREHADHRATGFAAISAAFPSARLPDYFPAQVSEGLPLVTVEHGFFFSSEGANMWLELNESHISKKRLAINSHLSQTVSTNEKDAIAAIVNTVTESAGSVFLHAERFTYAALK